VSLDVIIIIVIIIPSNLKVCSVETYTWTPKTEAQTLCCRFSYRYSSTGLPLRSRVIRIPHYYVTDLFNGKETNIDLSNMSYRSRYDLSRTTPTTSNTSDKNRWINTRQREYTNINAHVPTLVLLGVYAFLVSFSIDRECVSV
jgi:hypothetical protein